jgi:hypothetical protein
MNLEIRNNIPIMPHRPRVRHPLPITMSKMEIGDCVDVPPLGIGYYRQSNVYRAASWAKIRIQLRTLVNGQDGITTDVVLPDQPFYRIWRTS